MSDFSICARQAVKDAVEVVVCMRVSLQRAEMVIHYFVANGTNRFPLHGRVRGFSVRLIFLCGVVAERLRRTRWWEWQRGRVG